MRLSIYSASPSLDQTVGRRVSELLLRFRYGRHGLGKANESLRVEDLELKGLGCCVWGEEDTVLVSIWVLREGCEGGRG